MSHEAMEFSTLSPAYMASGQAQGFPTPTFPDTGQLSCLPSSTEPSEIRTNIEDKDVQPSCRETVVGQIK